MLSMWKALYECRSHEIKVRHSTYIPAATSLKGRNSSNISLGDKHTRGITVYLPFLPSQFYLYFVFVSLEVHGVLRSARNQTQCAQFFALSLWTPPSYCCYFDVQGLAHLVVWLAHLGLLLASAIHLVAVHQRWHFIVTPDIATVVQLCHLTVWG